MGKALKLLIITSICGLISGCSIKGSGLPSFPGPVGKVIPKLELTGDLANPQWNQIDYARQDGVRTAVTQEYIVPEASAFSRMEILNSQWMTVDCDLSLIRLFVTVESRGADGIVDHVFDIRVEDPSKDHSFALEPAYQQSLVVTASNIPNDCQVFSYSFLAKGVNQ